MLGSEVTPFCPEIAVKCLKPVLVEPENCLVCPFKTLSLLGDGPLPSLFALTHCLWILRPSHRHISPQDHHPVKLTTKRCICHNHYLSV